MFGIGNKLLLYGGIALAAVAGYFGWKHKVKSEATNEERAKRQQEVLEAAKDRQEIDQDVSTRSDEQLDDLLRPPTERK